MSRATTRVSRSRQSLVLWGVMLGLVACVAVLGQSAMAATDYTYINLGGTGWGDGANWNPNGTPGKNDNVTLDFSPSWGVYLDADREVNNFTISSASPMLQATGAHRTLTVNGTFNMSAGRIEVTSGASSDWVNLQIKNGQWTGGTMLGNGTTTILAGGNVSIGGTMQTNPAPNPPTPNLVLSRTLTNNGTVNVIDAMTLGGSGTFNNNGTFQKTSGTGTSTVNWTVNNSGSILGNSGELKFAGGFTNTGTVTANGGTITYSGATSQTSGAIVNNATVNGALTINGGEVNGSGAFGGAVTVNNASASLKGTGTYSSLVTVTNGTIAPGNSAGILTFNGGLTLKDSAKIDFEIGTTSDRIDTSNLTLTLGSGKQVALNVSKLDTLGGTLDQALIVPVITFDNAITDVDKMFALTQNLPANWQASLSAGTFGSKNALMLTVVPEPATIAMLLGLGLMAGVWFWRKRK